jgi:aldehyde dehydrogenase family 7 protein A1
MGAFTKKEHQFLAELGLAPRNPGSFTCGAWGGSGPVVTSTSPANNQVSASTSARPDQRGFPRFRVCFSSLCVWILRMFTAYL